MTVSVHPASGSASDYFILSARPGGVAPAGYLTITNRTARPLKVRLDPVNGVTDSMLGADYGLAGQPAKQSARWIALSARRLTIPPYGTRYVQVGLQVARSAKGGEYLSGIAVQAEGEEQVVSAGRGIRIGETYRYAVGVATRVPGRLRPRIVFTGVQLTRYPSSVAFLLLASNTGNAIVKNVHGSVLITRGKHKVISKKIEPGTFVSYTSIKLPVLTPREHPKVGTLYCVRAKLVYQGGVARLNKCLKFGRHAAKIQALYTRPARRRGGGAWVALGGAIVAALALALGAYLWRRHLRRYPLSRGATASALRRALAAGRAQGKPVGLIQLDIHGSSRGLERQVVKALRPALRASDSIGRLGESALLVILPATGEEFAKPLAGELTAALAASALDQTSYRMRVGSAPATSDAETLMAELTRSTVGERPSGFSEAGATA